MNFKRDSVNEYQFVKNKRWIGMMIGLICAVIGGGLYLIPNGLRDDVIAFANKSGFKINAETIDKLLKYWYLLLIIGGLIIVITLLIPYSKKCIVTAEGLTIVRSDREVVYPYGQMRKIEDYYSGGKRGLRIYFKERGGSMFIRRTKIIDYPSLFHDLKEKHKNQLLGETFPENIESVQFPVSKHLSIDKGKFLYKDQEIPFSRVHGFTTIQEEMTYNIGISIAVSNVKYKIIKIMPTEIENDDALYELLRVISVENP